VEVLARPGSQRRGLVRIEPRGLVIAVASPPEKGKANQELMATIADIAEVARAEVSILRGASTHNKVIRIDTAEPSTMARRLSGLIVKAK
jgi:uncharacterized protein